jgi:serine/threonine-protein kinase
MADTKNNRSLEGLTIAIEFSDAVIKAAVYDESTKIPQPVSFDNSNPEFIPSVIYLPQDDVNDTLFGCLALGKMERDPSGIFWNIITLLEDDERDIARSGRKTQNKQALVNNLIRYIKEQAEEQALNSRKLVNCVFVLEEDVPESVVNIFYKAAKAAGFKNSIHRSRLSAIANYWMFYHNAVRYEAAANLIVVDVRADKTNLAFLQKNEEGFEPIGGAASSFDLGWNSVADLVWENMEEQGTVSVDGELDDLKKTEIIRTVLQEAIFDPRAFYYKGVMLEIPARTLVKAQEDFCRLLKSGVSQFVDYLGAEFSDQTELAIVMNVDSEASLTSVSDEISPGNSFTPDHPGFTVTLGGTLPDDPAWLQEQNLTSKLKLAPGVKFGVYTILRSLGKGGMGEVWLAHHETMDIPVAIKVVHSHLTQSSDSVDRFLSEIRHTAKLRHSNIVRAHDAGCLHGIHFMVSDYVNGESLTSKLDRNEVFTESEVLKIGRFVADALKHAWSKHKILHRDIKPDNIMIDVDGSVMLMDMGISKSLLEKAPELTSADTLLGTPYYMSPEQIKGDESDFHADIYSLGATLYHLATGTRPYEADSIINVATMHITEPVPNAGERNPDLSESFVNILQKMMAKEPEERQESWDDVIKDIDLALYQNEDFIEEENIEQDSKEEYNKGKKSNVLLLLALGLSLIIIMIMLTTGSDAVDDSEDNSETAPIRFSLVPKKSKITITKNGQIYNKYDNILVEDNTVYLTSGTYNVSVKHDGYKEQSRRVVVSGDPRLYRFILDPYLGSKVLKIHEGFTYLLLDAQGEKVVDGVVDAGNQVSLSVPVGDYKLELTKDGYVNTTADITVYNGENEPQVIEAKLQGGTFRFNTENNYDLFHKNSKIGSTNQNIAVLEPGTYELTVSRNGFRSRMEKVTVTDKPSLPVRIEELEALSGDIQLKATVDVAVEDRFIPSEVQIKVDDAPWKRVKLPLLLEDYRCKHYEIALKAQNFIVKPAVAKLWNAHDKVSDVNFKLIPVPAVARVTSAVNVPLYLGDKLIGHTNKRISLVSYVPYKLKAVRKGYQDTFVMITGLPEKEVVVKLPKMKKRQGDLRVTMTPSPLLTKDAVLPDKVEMRINGGAWQSVALPISMEKIPSIDYEIELKALNYNFTPEKFNFFLKEKQLNTVNFELFPEKVPVLIKSNVKGAKIYSTDGKEIGEVGTYVRLAPFVNYTLILKKEGYKDYELRLLVNKLLAPRRELIVSMKRAKGAVLGQDWEMENLGIKMKNIKPGTFWMGDKNGKSDERNRHKVTLTENFWMSDTPVTQAQFKKVMGYNPSVTLKDVDCSDYPVVNVSWNDAVKFCRKLTEMMQKDGFLREEDEFALPTEAEWEYCCKAGTTTPFYFGDELSSDEANIDGTFSFKGKRGKMRGFTTKVASFQPNAWGLYDMHGNVWEWCNDTYEHTYTMSESVNPRGAAVIADEKVLRGGSWKSYPKNSRSTARYYRSQLAEDMTIGFRIVLRIRD